MKRYLVETCFKPGVWVLLMATDNRDRAIERANFWDARQDTRFTDTALESPLDRAMRRFDEAIARLEARRLDNVLTRRLG